MSTAVKWVINVTIFLLSFTFITYPGLTAELFFDKEVQRKQVHPAAQDTISRWCERRGALMTSKKLSSATKRLVAETSVGEADRPMNLLIRVAGSLPPETEAVIRGWGGHVRTQAGDVVSLTLPLRHLSALVQLEPILYVEVAGPLFQEQPEQGIGE